MAKRKSRPTKGSKAVTRPARSITKRREPSRPAEAFVSFSQQVEYLSAIPSVAKSLAGQGRDLNKAAKGIRNLAKTCGKRLRDVSHRVITYENLLNQCGQLREVAHIGSTTASNAHTATISLVRDWYFGLWFAVDPDSWNRAFISLDVQVRFDCRAVEREPAKAREFCQQYKAVDFQECVAQIHRERSAIISKFQTSDGARAADGLMSEPSSRVTSQMEKEHQVDTEVQRLILTALDGAAMTLDKLEEATRRRRRTLFGGKDKRGGLHELMDQGRVRNDRKIGGYYRPNAPPQLVD